MKPQPIKQRIESYLTDRIEYKLTTRTKDRIADRVQEQDTPGPRGLYPQNEKTGTTVNAATQAQTQRAYLPHINSWSDSRPQNSRTI